MLKYLAVLGVALGCMAGPLQAQDLVHTPISPTFGGNPFNSNHVLGIANAQNDTRDPRTQNNNTQADIFSRQLESRLLSALSTQVVDAIFGDNPQDQGTISFGGQTIEFFRTLDEVVLILRDDNTGEETRIVVPLFIDVD